MLSMINHTEMCLLMQWNSPCKLNTGIGDD